MIGWLLFVGLFNFIYFRMMEIYAIYLQFLQRALNKLRRQADRSSQPAARLGSLHSTDALLNLNSWFCIRLFIFIFLLVIILLLCCYVLCVFLLLLEAKVALFCALNNK